MTFATAEEVETIRGIWGTTLTLQFEAARDWALQRLREDLVKPDEHDHPDSYLYRANAVPLGLMGAGQFAMAEQIYDRLIPEVDAFNKARQTRKHRGALLANQAVCQIVLKRFDAGVPRLIFTVKDEDWKTFGEAKTVTPAMHHLRQLFELPALGMLSLWSEGLWLGSTGSRPTTSDFDDAVQPLGTAKWSLFASVQRTNEIWEAHLAYPSDYAGPRLLDGIRGLSASLEHLAKSIGRTSNDPKVRSGFVAAQNLTLFPCYERLFDGIGPAWWTRVKEAHKMQRLTSFHAGSGAADFRNKMETILGWSATDLDSLTAKCLTLALLARNYSVHELEPPDWFLRPDNGRIPFAQLVSYLSCALLALSQAATLCGHIGAGTHAR